MKKLILIFSIIFFLVGDIFAQYPDVAGDITPLTIMIGTISYYEVPSDKLLYILNIYSASRTAELQVGGRPLIRGQYNYQDIETPIPYSITNPLIIEPNKILHLVDVSNPDSKMFINGYLKNIERKYWECGCDSLYDERDGKFYKTIQVLDYCWMAENLSIGGGIAGIKDMTDNGFVEKYCYDNDYSNSMKYGGLYQWDEMMQYDTSQNKRVQGICPEGWHIPTDAEWKILQGWADSQFDEFHSQWDLLGYKGFDVGKNLKSKEGWIENGNGVDLYGFGVLPTGNRRDDGIFANINLVSHFWTSTDDGEDNAYYRQFFHSMENINRKMIDKRRGLCVRCIKDY